MLLRDGKGEIADQVVTYNGQRDTDVRVPRPGAEVEVANARNEVMTVSGSEKCVFEICRDGISDEHGHNLGRKLHMIKVFTGRQETGGACGNLGCFQPGHVGI